MSKFVVRKRKGGFTLIEIMIVVLIISVLLAIAIPNFMRARETSRAKSCCSNLRQIETAKEQWAMDNKASDGDDVTGDLWPDYIKDEPQCPSGGDYTVNPIGTNAECSIGDQGDSEDYNDHVIR
ncbi:MAG: prepilin-type N-terminal cleavage/methylation domain-containing protein [Armatimonadetes bacterium]|nr:prepilin-type N-terminal cleavage/methylation domain-containing protein [Armatimonadota bacterium]